jgi:peptidoglycan-associated lipoprotein
MKLRVFSVLAAVALLAACEQAPQTTATKAGAGQTHPMVAGPVAGSPEDFVRNVGNTAYFDFDKSNLRPDAQAALAKQVAWLKHYPTYDVVIQGNCDERGTREYNLALGARRANSAEKFMVNNGIAASRIKTISFGKERPVCVASTEKCWAENRRDVTVITGGK